MNKIKSIVSDEFNITLTVTNSCNYRCKYCPTQLHNGSEEPILVETYIKFFTNLIKENPQINDYSNRFVSISGGEPSLYDGIEELITFFNDNNFNASSTFFQRAAVSLFLLLSLISRTKASREEKVRYVEKTKDRTSKRVGLA